METETDMDGMDFGQWMKARGACLGSLLWLAEKRREGATAQHVWENVPDIGWYLWMTTSVTTSDSGNGPQPSPRLSLELARAVRPVSGSSRALPAGLEYALAALWFAWGDPLDQDREADRAREWLLEDEVVGVKPQAHAKEALCRLAVQVARHSPGQDADMKARILLLALAECAGLVAKHTFIYSAVAFGPGWSWEHGRVPFDLARAAVLRVVVPPPFLVQAWAEWTPEEEWPLPLPAPATPEGVEAWPEEVPTPATPEGGEW